MIRASATPAAWLIALLGLSLSPSSVAGGAPRHVEHGSTACMGAPFHFTGFSYRIMAIHWVPVGSRFATAIGPYVAPVQSPKGYLIFKVPVENVQSGEANAPGVDITAFYKDGVNATTNETPFSSSGASQMTINIPPGQGLTVYYAIPNVPRPTRSNPVARLTLRYAANNDPGYPDTYYMRYPIVSPWRSEQVCP